MVKVKICGMTNAQDLRMAVEEGADAVGFIFYRKSPRFVAIRTVKEMMSLLPPFVEAVGVFVDESADRVNRIAESCKLDIVQLHGNESPGYCKKIRRRVVKAVRVRDEKSFALLSAYQVSGFLLDTYSEGNQGGTGRTFDWNLVHRGKKYGPVILAGGLNSDNVSLAVSRVKPYGVDVCSGVEKSPGIKDPEKVRAFIQAAKGIQDT
ncbi:MAG: phosphoribosylanthranilate isomerase [Nitrospinaceae bacterium]